MLVNKKSPEGALKAGITVVHCREGHMPDLSDYPYNKLLRSKIIGKDAVGIGEKPKGAVGRLLIRGSESWGIVKEVEPIKGEVLVDKAGERRRLLQRLLCRPAAARYHTPDLMRHHYRCLCSYHHEGGQ
jgi:hypothetical protein